MQVTRRDLLAGTAATTMLAGVRAGIASPASTDALSQGFRDPPAAARPRVWWHWMDGNITEEGIKLDLAWMRGVGIGGVQNFDAALDTPQVVEKRLAYMTPEWKRAFRLAVDEAKRMGLEFAIAASPGWSETGGPWVEPQDGMKKLVWATTEVKGGARAPIATKAPPKTTGPFQNAPKAIDPIAAKRDEPPPEHYRDVAVLAFPSAGDERIAAQVSTSAGAPSRPATLGIGRPDTNIDVPLPNQDAPSWLLYAFAKPALIQSVSLATASGATLFTGGSFKARVEMSDNGRDFRPISELPAGATPQYTVSFAPVRTRFLRVLFERITPRGLPFKPMTGVELVSVGSIGKGEPAKSIAIAALTLSGRARVHRFEEKAAFENARDYFALEQPDVMPGIDPASVIDLTSKLRPDGSLDWTPPPGNWTILRLGYSLTGKENHPATAEATGLEVDKFDSEAVERYIDRYLAMYAEAVGEDKIGPGGITALLTDSIEVGPANWTPALLKEFRARRGYDATPWLPALTGTVIGDSKRTDAFLFDFRRTLADLIVDAHYRVIADKARASGLRLYGEALEFGRPSLGDDMAMRQYTSVPMAAMWTYPDPDAGPRQVYRADIRGAASVAHIYGQNLVAAESLTSAWAPWAFAPHHLKPMIDIEFALGVNLPIIHTSVHQPVTEKAPGMSLAIFGQHFNRLETWAESAKPWVDYLARTAYLLQAGRSHADVLYFYGEEAPLTAVFNTGLPEDAPLTHDYDFANFDVLLNRVEVQDGLLVTQTGQRYRLLWLGGASHRMTLPALRRVKALVESGATVAGIRPERSPSLRDDAREVAALVTSIWPTDDQRERRLGQGRVLIATNAEEVMRTLGVTPDFAWEGADDAKLMFKHRALPDGHIYFLTNRRARPERVTVRLGVAGLEPVLWRATDGQASAVQWRAEGGATRVELDLLPDDAVFIVLRKGVEAPKWSAIAAPETLATLADGWTLHLPKEPPRPIMPGSWSESPDAALRYFSGTATYRMALDVKPEWLGKGHLFLDFGPIGDLAEVRINGKPAGTIWSQPWSLPVNDKLKPGRNVLEVSVTNLWVNRLIGEAQPGAVKKTFTTSATYRPDAPLRPSGLLRPVRLIRQF